MNDIGHLTIPGDQVGAVTKTLLGLYGARAESVGAVALAVVDPNEERVQVEHARRELRAIEDALMDVGWPDRTPDGPVEIVGSPRVLREVARMSVIDAADRVVEAVCRYEAGGEDLPEVRRAVEAVPSLFELFAALERRAQAHEGTSATERGGARTRGAADEREA